ncbi:MAG: hypothetical protein D6731_20120 [Planctomycetota bacterium]|nr:MAG: hypothetical protein D6731_20120 [Planctomycetota bacterium]
MVPSPPGRCPITERATELRPLRPACARSAEGSRSLLRPAARPRPEGPLAREGLREAKGSAAREGLRGAKALASRGGRRSADEPPAAFGRGRRSPRGAQAALGGAGRRRTESDGACAEGPR